MDIVTLRNEKKELLEACLKYKEKADKLQSFLEEVKFSISPCIWISLDPDMVGIQLNEDTSKKIYKILEETQKEYEQLFDSIEVTRQVSINEVKNALN